ncbi:MAG: hypothetical protein ACLFM0_09160, partial [Spirochaetales bacterium]
MATTIQVEIEHRRYVDLCVARRGEQGRLNITTIDTGQTRAMIKLFAARGSRRTPLQTIDVRGLPTDPHRHIPMQLSSAVVSGGKLRVRLYVQGSLFLERFVPVGRFLVFSRTVLVALFVLLLFALTAVAVGFFGVHQDGEPRGADAGNARETQEPETGVDNGSGGETPDENPEEIDPEIESGGEPDERGAESGGEPDERGAESGGEPDEREAESGGEPDERGAESGGEPDEREAESGGEPDGREAESGGEPDEREAESGG